MLHGPSGLAAGVRRRYRAAGSEMHGPGLVCLQDLTWQNAVRPLLALVGLEGLDDYLLRVAKDAL